MIERLSVDKGVSRLMLRIVAFGVWCDGDDDGDDDGEDDDDVIRRAARRQ